MAFKPLEKKETKVLNFKTDSVELVSVLDESVCETRIPKILYSTIPEVITNSEFDAYISMIEKVTSNLEWVLSLSHQKFWCQVLHDQGLQQTLDSYLKFAPRYETNSWKVEFKNKHDKLHKLVFMTFLRMSTPKESPKEFITASAFGELIYSNYLFDIPRIIDLSSLYANPSNLPLLQKLVESVFKHQKGYYEDLKQAADVLIEVLSEVETTITGDVESSNRLVKIGETKFDPLANYSSDKVCDIILYVSDIFSSLQLFIGEVFPKACTPYYEAGLFEKLPTFHDLVHKKLRRGLQGLAEEESRDKMLTHVEKCRSNVVKLTRSMIAHALFQPLVESPDAEYYSTAYFHILHSIIDDADFVADLKMTDEIGKGVETAIELCPAASKQSVATEVLKTFKTTKPQPVKKENVSKPRRQKEKLPSKKVENKFHEDLVMTEAASYILEIFPDKEMDFVRKCLQYYNCDKEKLCQAFLENNLPPHLSSSSSPDPVAENGTSSHYDQPGPSSSRGISHHQNHNSNDLVSHRRNVFDGDQFDVFNSADPDNLDWSRVQMGKDKMAGGQLASWKDDLTTNQRLNEKHRLTTMYDTYHSSDDDEDDVIPLNPNYICNYEDERDDFGDEHEVGVNDHDASDDESQRRSNTTYHNKTPSPDRPHSSSHQQQRWRNKEQQPQSTSHKVGDFVRNPEEVRAEREAKRQQQFQNNRGRGRGRGGGRHGNGGTASSSGNPPNPNQQAIDRRRKDQNKAKRANHNRKNAATRKMASAMK